MKLTSNIWLSRALLMVSIAVCTTTYTKETETKPGPELAPIVAQPLPLNQRVVDQIVITGTKHTKAVRNFFTQLEGEQFNADKIRSFFKKLYHTLNRFRDIKVYAEELGTDRVILHISVEEKLVIKDLIFDGNKHVTAKAIKEKINLDTVPAIDPEETGKFVQQIKKLYLEKGYHSVQIDTKLDIDEEKRATITFTITENEQSLVKRIHFIGNDHFTDKVLRAALYTREDWLLSFLDKAGMYNPEMVEADTHMIEQFYQDRGYYRAKVVDAITDKDPETKQYAITFEIQEGERYAVAEVSAPGNEVLTEEQLLMMIPVRAGQIYSRKRLADTIKLLERIWGNQGYIFAHINPMMQVNDDDKTVSISFESEIGNPITLNRVNIRGNHKTRDNIIRRQITLEEGDPITTMHMDASKSRVESLGYFEQKDGVNWKMVRINDTEANLDLMLKEAKTGNAGIQLNFGGRDRAAQSVIGGISFEGSIADTNIVGSGVQGSLTARLSKDDQSFLLNITQPWMFDKPIYGALDAYHKRVGYEELHHTRPVNEVHTGGSLTSGFSTGYRSNFLFSDMFVRGSFGIDNIRYEKSPQAIIPLLDGAERQCAEDAYNCVLKKLFDPGTFVWLTAQCGQERRNHPIHPSYGYSWLTRLQIGVPSLDSNIGFGKFDLDWHWYTPLIGAYDLVFHLHAYVGIIHKFNKRVVPYREMYHVGGPSTIRGFLFGQVGPQLAIPDTEGTLRTDSIGATRAAYINAELVFPITPDFNMKGVIFYDGGTGWNNPYVSDLPCNLVANNGFDYRHSVGFGIRVMNPVPVKIDWGFKIDPRKGEVASEVHFGMSYGF